VRQDRVEESGVDGGGAAGRSTALFGRLIGGQQLGIGDALLCPASNLRVAGLDGSASRAQQLDDLQDTNLDGVGSSIGRARTRFWWRLRCCCFRTYIFSVPVPSLSLAIPTRIGGRVGGRFPPDRGAIIFCIGGRCHGDGRDNLLFKGWRLGGDLSQHVYGIKE